MRQASCCQDTAQWPGLAERERLVRLYFDKYVLQPTLGQGRGRKLSIEEMDYQVLCSEVAVVTDGMSGREIAKLGVAWQAGGYCSEDGVVRRTMIMEKVKEAQVAHSQKMSWLSDEENRENRQVAYRTPGPAPALSDTVAQLGFTAKTFS